MIKKIAIFIITTLTLVGNVNAASDGELLLKKNDPSEIKECWEGFNRASFALNQGLDKIIFKPVASVYRTLPSPVKTGVSNSLNNLSNVVTIPNNLLQGEFSKAGDNTIRFIINTTFGILGFIDVANYIGLPKYEKEDYGQTLAVHGLGPGCYLVLPVLGPTTARDAAGSTLNFLGGDAWYNVTVQNDTKHFSDFDYYSSKATAGVDFRAKNYDSINNVEKNSIDFYASVKSLYLQDRQQKILNTDKIVDTQNDSDWEEIEN
ncbi:MlaA family lipoprotein [Candidatus Pelagibacter communis]|uniref:MlaA family lipoprotein n=1 Tax=Pelagibacter ubique TaxID=198252 RepID=UPI000AB70013|nr:VacJ family lipoprotein [Candidatus Pelagibacter ubique]|tara:strand:- start:310 stop:1095 length:786 start_codon:yes stop_codon:yes gene_type:complete